jgi:hypothetical protein
MMGHKVYNVAELEHEKGPDFRQIYSNNTTMGMSFFDASITFGELMPDVPTIAPKVADRVTVTMSWEHLKALYESVGKVIAAYEESQNTKIRTPSEQLPILAPKELAVG